MNLSIYLNLIKFESAIIERHIKIRLRKITEGS